MTILLAIVVAIVFIAWAAVVTLAWALVHGAELIERRDRALSNLDRRDGL